MIVFVDTNIWVYAVDDTEPHKQAIAQAYLTQMASQNTLALSTQVMQEFFNVTTGKGKRRLPHDVTLGHLEDMSVHMVIESTVQGVLVATSLMQEHKISWWDSLILEAAIRAKADVLASEDGQPGRMFGKLIVENPFAN